MLAVVYWLPTGGLLAQVNWLGPEVGGHWRCFCSHRVNRVNSGSVIITMTVPGIIILLLLLVMCRAAMSAKHNSVS